MAAGTIQQAFQHRSARVIACSRAALAFFFALAIWLDPGPHETGSPAFPLLILFMVYSTLVLGATWNSWWLESKLSPFTHLVDLAVFAILVFLTEGYTSPFFTFFVFLVLAAAMRWGWREALLTTSAVVLLYVGASLSASSGEAEAFEVQRFVVRGSHLIVLSFMIIWFGVNQGKFGSTGASAVMEESAAGGPPALQALAYASARLGAEKAVFTWSEPEEPWLNVWTLEDGDLHMEQHGPDAFPDLVAADIASPCFIFDARAHRMLSRSASRRLATSGSDPISTAFASRFGLGTGIAMQIEGGGYEGWMFTSRIRGLCSDDLELAAEARDVVSLAFERYALFSAHEESAASRSRLLLARDLHDSVVQFLAGIALKLQSLRRQYGDSSGVARELEELQLGVAQEQRDLRKLLAALREPSAPAGSVLLKEHFLLLSKRLEQQWGVRCEINVSPPSLTIDRSLEQEIELLVREGVANAVRHGSARTVTIDVFSSNEQLQLCVTDDGSGFPQSGSFDDAELRERGIGPKSLSERVHALGGTVGLTSTNGSGSRVTVGLQLRDRAA